MQTICRGFWILLAASAFGACGSDDNDNTNSDTTDTDTGTPDGGDTADSETVEELPLNTYYADDERIQYTGRIDFTDPAAPVFSGGATYIKIRFTGVSLSLLLDFAKLYGNTRVFMDVQIDDNDPVMIEPDPDKDGKYEVATGLPNTEHKVTVVRRSQPDRGQSTFLGVEISGELLDPPARLERRIQIIGDSIAAGEGSDVESSSECSGDWSADQQYQNTRLTFGPMLADALDADYHVIAWSGKGLYLNYDDTYDDRLMPELYELMFIERTDSIPWDHELYVPDAIFIELGTNDFGPSVSGDRTIEDITLFVDPYMDFVDTLLEYYPDAEIFALSSVLLAESLNADLEDALDLVETHYTDLGIDQVHAIDVTKISAKGCNGHPTAAQHQDMADDLETPVRDVMGW